MFNPWFFIAASLAVIDWVGTGLHWIRVRLFTKGATLAALIVWFTSIGGWRDELAWFGLGLVFGMVGDVFLQLSPRFFMAGLGSFFAGHVCYILGFVSAGIALNLEGLIIGAVFIAAAGLDGYQLLRKIGKRPENAAMRVPIISYMTVITVMMVCAGLTLANPAWPFSAAICCALGAVLFLTSDSVLAHQFFATPLPNSDLIVMVTYHLAQFLIAAGVLLGLA